MVFYAVLKARGRDVIAWNRPAFGRSCGLLAQRRAGNLCPGILGHILAPVGVESRAVSPQEVIIIAVHLAGIQRQGAKGTPFQQAVWAQLHKIPYGEVRTYGQLAAALGKPKASRAVGSACHRNPLCIVVPCHRVIGADGSLTGYAEGLEIKEYLLELERF